MRPMSRPSWFPSQYWGHSLLSASKSWGTAGKTVFKGLHKRLNFDVFQGLEETGSVEHPLCNWAQPNSALGPDTSQSW